MFCEKTVLKIFSKFLENPLQKCILKACNYANTRSVIDVFLGISQLYSGQLFFKRILLIDVPYLIKEHLGMSAFDEATIKKNLVEVSPHQS